MESFIQFQQPPSTSSQRHVTVVIIQSMKSSSLPQRITKSIQFPLRTYLNNHNLNTIMNDSGDDKKDVKSGDDVKVSEKLPEKLPDPPEKPLAGDCCGSGCVRCVWDVYYEELEEYNKIVKDLIDDSKAS